MGAKKTRVKLFRQTRRYHCYYRRRRQPYLIVNVAGKRQRISRTKLLSRIQWVPSIIAKRLARIGYTTFDDLAKVLRTRPIGVHTKLQERMQLERHNANVRRTLRRHGHQRVDTFLSYIDIEAKQFVFLVR